MTKRLALGCALLVLVAACGEPAGSDVAGVSTTSTTVPGAGAGDAGDTTTTTVPAEREDRDVQDPTPEQIPPTTVPHGITGEAPQEIIDAVVADLVERAGADGDEIRVVVDEFVIWNDGSLGCPQPGQAYTQALVEGYRIVLEYAGSSYDYHTSERGSFVLCEGQALSGGGSASLIGRDPAGAAVADLAARLGITESEVALVSSRVLEVQTGFPCGPTAAQEEGALPGGLSVGTEILLSAGDSTYRYVSASGRLTYCGS
jgi:hypothetical protein